MEILMTQIDNITSHKSELQGPHKVPEWYLHSPAVVNEIHFNPKQHAPKSISKTAPKVPGPDSYLGRATDGPVGPEGVRF